MGHGVGEQNQPFKKLQIPGGRGAPKYPLERIFGQGGGGGGRRKNLPWGVRTFSGTTQCNSNTDDTACSERFFVMANQTVNKRTSFAQFGLLILAHQYFFMLNSAGLFEI